MVKILTCIEVNTWENLFNSIWSCFCILLDRQLKQSTNNMCLQQPNYERSFPTTIFKTLPLNINLPDLDPHQLRNHEMCILEVTIAINIKSKQKGTCAFRRSSRDEGEENHERPGNSSVFIFVNVNHFRHIPALEAVDPSAKTAACIEEDEEAQRDSLARHRSPASAMADLTNTIVRFDWVWAAANGVADRSQDWLYTSKILGGKFAVGAFNGAHLRLEKRYHILGNEKCVAATYGWTQRGWRSVDYWYGLQLSCRRVVSYVCRWQ